MAASGPTLEGEWRFLLAACSPNPQEAIGASRSHIPRLRWKLLFELAEHHGVLPLLRQSLTTAPDIVPVDEMRALEKSYQTNLHKALLLSREFIRVADRLDSIGAEFLPYKGLALAEAVYGDIALRQSGDIDLLIRPRDLPRICDAVRELGYTPHTLLSEAEQRAYLKSGYECAFDCAAGRNLLEVQWATQPRFYAVAYQMEGLFERAVPSTIAGRSVKTPCLEDLFIVLSLHAAKHVWGRLIWLCDLARIVNSPSLNWNWIGSQARKMGVARILRVSLLLANRLLGSTVPSDAESNLPRDSRIQALSEQIERQMASQSAFDVESFDYFRLMIGLRERQADRLKFLGRLVFTPGPGEWKVIRLPRALFSLYRLVRITRLLARTVRS
ncbi:MAG: nucleotidyltransferase domain-containing protein [Candidatus Sulfotelmatobacter sp.]